MAIKPTLKKSFITWNLVYLIITGGLGVWGAYDYWVTIPERERLVGEYEALLSEARSLAKRAEDGQPLSQAQAERYEEIQAIQTDVFNNTPPPRPARYDRALNFWVYFIGTGVLGAPWFFWRLISKRRTGPGLNDEGDLVDGDATYPADTLSGIDMAKWMSKSLAKVSIAGHDEPIVLDDYVYKDTYLVVGALANRFHPDAWTEEAKPIKPDEDESVAPETPESSPEGAAPPNAE